MTKEINNMNESELLKHFQSRFMVNDFTQICVVGSGLEENLEYGCDCQEDLDELEKIASRKIELDAIRTGIRIF